MMRIQTPLLNRCDYTLVPEHYQVLYETLANVRRKRAVALQEQVGQVRWKIRGLYRIELCDLFNSLVSPRPHP